MKQQIIISGVGGQGVLFVTRLLAEAAILRGLPVFTSETHGMAQRGGTVVSHLKVGEFSSPLIRPSCADGLLALKAENVSLHGAYLNTGAWAVVNSSEPVSGLSDCSGVFTADADTYAQEIGTPKSVNLVLLGFALARIPKENLFCTTDDVRSVMKNRLANRKDMLDASVKALETGHNK
ncbi:indolepyruvate oxidoreductase subunit beta [Desulfococcaceae bacterium HSG8]|nr:indolepyruvate oxidoreductase subunit beta [Desulfococcaceae bacterium HSG8]